LYFIANANTFGNVRQKADEVNVLWKNQARKRNKRYGTCTQSISLCFIFFYLFHL